jgi:hypothetical protein
MDIDRFNAGKQLYVIKFYNLLKKILDENVFEVEDFFNINETPFKFLMMFL